MRSQHPPPASRGLIFARIGCPVARSALPASALSGQSRAPDSAAPDLVVLVRHAEQAGSSAGDPGLTELGQEKARDLARLLADAGITRIHSSDTRRTLETAGPLAERLGLDVEHYDPRALGAFRTVAGDVGREPGGGSLQHHRRARGSPGRSVLGPDRGS